MAEEPPRWWDDLFDACDGGRLPFLFSLQPGYPLTTDIPVWLWHQEAAPDSELVIELVQAGCSRSVAKTVQIVAEGLVSAPIHGRELTPVGPIFGAAVLEPGVIDVLIERFSLPEYAEGWRALADLVVEPARTRCLALADACADAETSEAEDIA